MGVNFSENNGTKEKVGMIFDLSGAAQMAQMPGGGAMLQGGLPWEASALPYFYSILSTQNKEIGPFRFNSCTSQ